MGEETKRNFFVKERKVTSKKKLLGSRIFVESVCVVWVRERESGRGESIQAPQYSSTTMRLIF